MIRYITGGNTLYRSCGEFPKFVSANYVIQYQMFYIQLFIGTDISILIHDSKYIYIYLKIIIEFELISIFPSSNIYYTIIIVY